MEESDETQDPEVKVLMSDHPAARRFQVTDAHCEFAALGRADEEGNRSILTRAVGGGQ